MKFGTIFPHQQVPHSRAAITEYIEVVEGAGFDYIAFFDHVLGADTRTRPEWSGPYGVEDEFHESFVLFGFLAATTRLELVSGVMVLPQRQTALVAKQAADLDLLLEGRLRLGVAIGWNPVEYEALGVPFGDRGARLEEQIELLRLLWTKESVDFEGRFHRVDRAGIAPLPLQRPIPIWLGGASRSSVENPKVTPLLQRIGRVSDGWITGGISVEDLEISWPIVGDAAEAAGRDRDAVGLQVNLPLPGRAQAGLDKFKQEVDLRRALGVTHLSVRMGRDSRTFAEHLGDLTAVAKCIEEMRG